MVRDTSREAYQSIESTLTAKQRQVMLVVYDRFSGRTFTRKQLARSLGWEINRVTGRVLELIGKRYLEEHGETVEDGRKAALLRIRQPMAQLELLAA
jgi:hypothetical protein